MKKGNSDGGVNLLHILPDCYMQKKIINLDQHMQFEGPLIYPISCKGELKNAIVVQLEQY